MPTYQCANCNKSFKISRLLQYHEEHRVCFKSVVCDKCGKLCKTQNALKMHKSKKCNQNVNKIVDNSVTEHSAEEVLTSEHNNDQILKLLTKLEQQNEEMR